MKILLVSVGSHTSLSPRLNARSSRLGALRCWLFAAAIGLAFASAPGSRALAGTITFNFDGNTIQQYTIPTTGNYTITADGAQGGPAL
jgi:hypothetical protein